MYWMHPSIPWLQMFPRHTSALRQFGYLIYSRLIIVMIVSHGSIHHNSAVSPAINDFQFKFYTSVWSYGVAELHLMY